MINITCKHCKKTFQVHPYRKNTAIFCSHSCKASFRIGDLHPRKRIAEKRTCTNCQKEYIVNKNFDRKVKFCSVLCSAKYSFSGYKNRRWAGGVTPVACPVCKKEFTPKRLGSVNKFCSPACRNIGTKVTQTCPGCNKQRRVSPSFVEDGRQYCTITCYRKNRISPNNIERTVQEGLKRSGIYFVSEFPVDRYHVDIFIPSVNLAVECDGTYWHKGREAHDTKKTNRLIEKGYSVIRLSEKEIRESPQKCIDKIISFISKSK